MAASASINGITFSAKHCRLFIDGAYCVELKKVEYGDSMEKTTQKNWNGVLLGEVEEEYKADCKIEVGITEFEKINLIAAALGVGIYGLPPLTLVVEYTNSQGLTQIDTIIGSIKKNNRSVGDNEKHIGNSLELNVVQPILWNGVPAYVPSM